VACASSPHDRDIAALAFQAHTVDLLNAAGSQGHPETGIGARIAVVLVVVAALGYAFHTTLARATYDYGPGPMTILLFRSFGTAIALYVILRLRRIDPWPRGKPLWYGLLLGVALAGMAAAMLSALYFIPASLLILIFYLFPMIIAAFSHFTGMHQITAVNVVALVAAFSGVAIALGVAPAGLDWRGVVLGLVAAFAVALNVVGCGTLLRTTNPIVLTFVMAVAMCLVFVIANAVQGELVLPRDTAGWWPLLGTVLAYILASVAFYTAIQSLGPPRVAIAMNVEPIFTISLAGIILGERLTPIQLLGAAIVVAAIFTNAYFGFRSRRAQAAAEDG
jgi:drug/metabolite transporter (DMT)-like permease